MNALTFISLVPISARGGALNKGGGPMPLYPSDLPVKKLTGASWPANGYTKSQPVTKSLDAAVMRSALQRSEMAVQQRVETRGLS